jgi:hypothetical protein
MASATETPGFVSPSVVPSAPGPTRSAPGATPTPTPTPTAARVIELPTNADDLGYHTVDSWAGLWVRDVVAAGPGFVAVGSDQYGGQVWTSSDGETWDRLPDDPQWKATEIFRVTTWKDGIIAAGLDANEHIVFWASTDGVKWKRAPDAPSLSFRARHYYFGSGVFRIAEIHNVLKVVAFPGCDCGSPRSDQSLLTWTSRDGTQWQRTLSDPPWHSYGPAMDTGAGWLRVGDEPPISQSTYGEYVGVIQSSADASTWTTVFEQGVSGMHGVHRFGDAFVALTGIGPLAAGGADLTRWDKATADELGLAESVSGLADNGTVTVAVGTINTDGLASPGKPTIWIFSDSR